MISTSPACQGFAFSNIHTRWLSASTDQCHCGIDSLLRRTAQHRLQVSMEAVSGNSRSQSCCTVQRLVYDMQQKLSTLDAEAAAASDRARQMEAKASSLESEKALLATAEQRLTNMVNDLSAKKHKLMAQSQVEQKV